MLLPILDLRVLPGGHFRRNSAGVDLRQPTDALLELLRYPSAHVGRHSDRLLAIVVDVEFGEQVDEDDGEEDVDVEEGPWELAALNKEGLSGVKDHYDELDYLELRQILLPAQIGPEILEGG